MTKLDRQGAFTAILGSAKTGVQGGSVRQLPLDEIHLNPDQPRKFFDERALQKLTASVREKGILQPVLVREQGGGYQLVAGERRYRAAQRVGLETIPAIIREVSDEEALELALIENLQREDLNPVEETDSTLKLLSTKLSIPVQDVLEAIRQSHYRALGRQVRAIGPSASADDLVDNNVVITPQVEAIEALFAQIGRYTASSFYSHRVPILKMPTALVEAVREGRLEYSKARVLASVKDEERRAKLLAETLERGFSLKQLQEAVRQVGKGPAAHTSVDVGSLKRKLTTERIGKLSTAKQRRLEKLLAQLDALLDG